MWKYWGIVLLVLVVWKLWKVFLRWRAGKAYLASLAGKCIVITGGGSGIGAALALEFVRKGCKVIVAGRRQAKLLRVVEECQDEIERLKLGKVASCDYFRTDCAILNDCKELINCAVESHGHIDMLSTNHVFGRVCNFEEIPEGELEQALHDMYRPTTFGTMYCTYFALPYLKESGGRILHTSTISCYQPTPKCSLYNSSKIALHAFFDTIGFEMGENEVSVTIACPGLVDTKTAGSYMPAEDMKFAMPVDKCARTMLWGAACGDRRIHMPLIDTVPGSGHVVFLLSAIAPRALHWVLRKMYSFAKKETGGIRDAIPKPPQREKRR